MELTIRADVSTHMRELKQWLAQTRDEPAEDMNGFFAARVDTYEAHMSVWDKAYGRVAELTPGDCGPLLDLGCGTGLELDRIFARWPELAVTGVDLCAAMLEKLRAKHAGRRLELRCADYLAMDLGAEQYGAVVSVESLHHFTPEQKLELYKKIHAALRPGGFFLEADYIACCEEEETLLRAESARARRRALSGSREHPGGCVHPLRHAADAGARACPAAGRGLFVLRGRGQHRGSHVPARPQIRLVTEKPYKRVRKL